MMSSFYKYLPVSKEDAKWGLYALNAGFGSISQTASYPSARHPSDYYFNWNNGRILSEYQLIYITQGKGQFESASAGTCKVEAGAVILLFPHEWHRYRPDEETGWYEYWVGFKGKMIDELVYNCFFSKQSPLIQVGFREKIVALFNDIAEQTREESSGYQAAISGAILHLLGTVYTIMKEKPWQNANASLLVSKAKLILRENAYTTLMAEQVAQQLGVSYSLFRKTFKKYTGISPGQYVIQLKIEKAKQLLAYPDRLIKDVAHETGFDSCFYFSKLFKEKTGLSPHQYRERYYPEAFR